jgi:DNA polymerase III epsilon subunit-like protein
MKFIHDLLFLEVTLSGQDPEKDQLLSLSAISLSKDNLLQTGNFSSAVKSSGLLRTLQEQSQYSGIPLHVLQNAPKHLDVIRTFASTFQGKYILVIHGLKTIKALEVAFKKHSLKFDYNSPVVDLWTLGLSRTLNQGIRKLPTLHTFLEMYNIHLNDSSDSSQRVKAMSELFKKLINS